MEYPLTLWAALGAVLLAVAPILKKEERFFQVIMHGFEFFIFYLLFIFIYFIVIAYLLEIFVRCFLFSILALILTSIFIYLPVIRLFVHSFPY